MEVAQDDARARRKVLRSPITRDGHTLITGPLASHSAPAASAISVVKEDSGLAVDVPLKPPEAAALTVQNAWRKREATSMVKAKAAGIDFV